MVFDLSQISGLGDYTKKTEKDKKSGKSRVLYFNGERPFLIVNQNTIELRCDEKLADVLKSEYESVMQSRFYGHGGIEIVLAGQLGTKELEDLIRLSYNLS